MAQSRTLVLSVRINMEPSYKFLAITRGTNERSVRGSQKGSTPKKTPYRICLVVLGVVSVPVHTALERGGFFCTYTYYPATPGPRAPVSSKTCSHSANNFSQKRACVVCDFLVVLAHEKERETTEGASESRGVHG